LVEQGVRYSVPKRRGNDPRKGRPKKRARWPGQHVYCGISDWEKMYVYGGHGKKQHLMCSGAREYSCWNGTTFDAELAARWMSQTVFNFVAALPGFDPVLVELITKEAAERQNDRSNALQVVQREIDRLGPKEERLVEAIELGDDVKVLVAALRDLQSKKSGLEFQMNRLLEHLPPPVELPSADALRKAVQQAFKDLALDSAEFADVMRKIIDKIYVFPVRLCDGGNPVLRAKFEVNLSPYLPEACQLPSLQMPLRRDFVVDLFEMPQRAAFREQVVRLRAEGLTERQVAQQLGLTITATQRASALQRLMDSRGLTDRYVPVTEPIEGNKRYRRHRHARYRPSDKEQGDAA
jgi:site-specific DNA recombinase